MVRSKIQHKKRFLFSVLAVFILMAVGVTVAYYSDTTVFNNLFHLGEDVTTFEEEFVPDDNWVPCAEVDKTATATNNNATPRYVRMKLDEYWRLKNSTISDDDHATTELPLTWTDSTDGVQHYAIINFQNEDDWELGEDGWYYYKEALEQDETTNSLLKSVTLNCKANLVGDVIYSDDGKTGNSTQSQYADSKYHLYVTFQMSDEEFVVQQHTITINPNGGYYASSADPTTVTVNRGKIFTLGEATMDGYSIDYWEVTSGNVGEYATNNRLNSNSFKVADDVTLTAHWAKIVARIERTQKVYPSIMAAENEAQTGDIITLLVDTSETVTNEKTVTLDLNNHTVIGSLTNTSTGNLTIINGEINNPNGAAVTNNGTLTIGVNDYKADGTANILSENVRLVGTTAGLLQTNDTYKFYYYDGYIEGDSGLIGGYDGSPSYRNTFDGVVVNYYPFVEHRQYGDRHYQHVELASSDRAVSKTSVHGDIYYYNLQDNINTSAITGYKIYIVRDFDASYTLTVPDGANITIDLVGFTVNAMDTITNNGTLQFEDSLTTSNRAPNDEANYAGALNTTKSFINNNDLTLTNIYVAGKNQVALENNYKLTMRSSTIKQAEAYLGYYALSPTENSIFDIDSCSYIRGRYPVHNTTTNFTFNSGNIIGEINSIINSSTAITTINGGIISGGTENFSDSILTGGSFVINGGTILDKRASCQYSTCVVIGTVNLTMNGGLIDGDGYAIYAYGSQRTININGGKIIGKNGIFVDSDITLTIGTDNGEFSTTTPEIIGKEYAIKTNYQFNFYGGVMRGGIAILNSANGPASTQNGIVIPSNSSLHIEESDEYAENMTLISRPNNFLSVNGDLYGSFEDAYNAITGDSGTITVVADALVESRNAESPSGKTITLDLNGHTLNLTQTLVNNSDFTIMDSSEEKTGKLNNSNISSASDPVIINNSKLTINSGTISSTKQKYVFMRTGQDYASFDINGGAIMGPIVSNYYYTDITMTGGLIESHRTAYTGNRGGTITITGGQIKAAGTGIDCSSCSTIIDTGDNETPTILIDSPNDSATGVLTYNIDFKSGKIDVTSSYNTTGLQATSGTMSGGVIEVTGNGISPSYTTYYSTGIYHSSSSYTLTVKSGTVKATRSDTATAVVRGIYNYYSSGPVALGTNDGAISTTAPEIIGDDYALSGAGINYYDGILKSHGKVFESASIFTNLPSLTQTHVESSDEYEEVCWLTELEPFLEVRGVGYNSFQAAFNALSSTDTIKLIADTDLATTIPNTPSGKTITFDLNGHKLTYNSSINNRSSRLNIVDESEEKTGTLNYIGTTYAIYNYTTLDVKSGSIISKGNGIYNERTSTSTSVTNYIYVRDGATIRANGSSGTGIAVNGKSLSRRSNVYIYGGEIYGANTGLSTYCATVTIQGGHISAGSYAGVRANHTTLTISAPADQEVITAPTGVSTNSSTTATFSSGIIHATKDSGWAIGISNEGDFTMNNGTINADGAVARGTVGNITINNGTINVAASRGIAIGVSDYESYSDSACKTRTIKNGTINVSAPSSYAAYGVYSYNSCSTTILGANDGTISTSSPEITANNYGFYNGNLTFYDGILKGQLAAIQNASSISTPDGYTTYTDHEAIGYKTYETSYLKPETYVAQIGDTKYTRLSTAISESVTGDTIDLIGDSEYSLEVPSGKDVTLNLNGYKLSANGIITNYGKINIVDNSASSETTFSNSNSGFFVVNQPNAELTLTNTSFNVYNGINNNGTLHMNNVSINATNTALTSSGTTTTDNGLTMTSQNKGNNVLYISGGTTTLTDTTITNGKIYIDNGTLTLKDSNDTRIEDDIENLITNYGTLSLDNTTVDMSNRMSSCYRDCNVTTPRTIYNRGMLSVTNNSTVKYYTSSGAYTGYMWNDYNFYAIYADSGSNISIDSGSSVISQNEAYNIYFTVTAIRNESSSTVTVDSATVRAEAFAGDVTGIMNRGTATITSGSITAKAHDITSDYYGISNGINSLGTTTLGTPEPTTSANYGGENADVSTTSPLITAEGDAAKTTGVNGSNVYYYDGKIVSTGATLSAAPTGVEYLYEPKTYVDGNNRNYTILEWMRTQP